MVRDREGPVDAAGAGAGGVVQGGGKRCRDRPVSRPGRAARPCVEPSETATVWVSPVSGSVKFSVPVGTGVVVSSAAEPWCRRVRRRRADSGPLVITTGWLVPRIVTVTSCVAFRRPDR